MSYKLKYTGKQIDDILDRAVEGGAIDDALALKAPLKSPALTGTPTAPTQAEGDDSTKVATTAYADRAADAAEAAAEAAAKEYTDRAADAAEAAAEAAAKEYTDRAASALYITDTASGPIASFSDGADGVAMRSVVVNITPVQSGSGDPAPDNVRPISGWTGAEITRTGKNLLDKNSLETGAIDENGNEVVSYGARRSGFIPVAADYVTYTNTYAGDANRTVFALYDANKTFIRRELSRNDVAGNPIVFTFPTTGVSYVRLSVAYNNIKESASNLQLELGSTATAYEPYAGQTFPVTWQSQAGEVFGGYFVVNSDGSVDLTATHNLNNFASGSWSINTDGSLPYFQRTVTTVDAEQRASALSNIYINQTPAEGNAYDMAFGFTGSNNFFRVRDSRYTTVADFVAHLQNDNVQFYYPLLTPQTYHLDSIGQIASLLGQNNVWSNTGDVEVEYVADPKLYIAKVLGGSALTPGSASPLSLNRPVTISEEDLEQAGEVNEAVEAAVETVLPAESGETEEGAQE